MKQECIPVGCVPSAAMAIYLGGCLHRGRGCLPRRRGCLPKRGVASPGGVCPGSVCPQGVCPGVVCLARRVYTSHPVDRIFDTHLWKYYPSTPSFCRRQQVLGIGKFICNNGKFDNSGKISSKLICVNDNLAAQNAN